MRRRRRLSIESSADGVEKQEKELMYIAELSSVDDLKSADKVEEKEQWTVFTPNGSIRVRKTGDDEYVMTSKIKTDDDRIKRECEQTVSKDMFEHYKAHADSGMIFTRYYFKTEYDKVWWEVDVFKNKDGESILPWVKVDLELPIVIGEPPKVPLDFKQMIAPGAKTTNPDDRDLANDLLRNTFPIKKDA